MKYVFLFFLVSLNLHVHSQEVYEIKLSTELNESRMGLWSMGDYKVYVELDFLETSFAKTGNGYIKEAQDNNYEDTVIAIYTLSANRYIDAALQLKKAENGFDLRTLAIYFGKENEKDNAGNSTIVEDLVRRLVENGSSAVYYKGVRVYTLKKQYESQNEGLDFGYDVLIYADSLENCVFKYYVHLGW